MQCSAVQVWVVLAELLMFYYSKLSARRQQGDVNEKEVETSLLTAVDVEDQWKEEKSKIQLASRITGKFHFTLTYPVPESIRLPYPRTSCDPICQLWSYPTSAVWGGGATPNLAEWVSSWSSPTIPFPTVPYPALPHPTLLYSTSVINSLNMFLQSH